MPHYSEGCAISLSPQDDPGYERALQFQAKLTDVQTHVESRLQLLNASGFAEHLDEIPSLNKILTILKK